MRLVIARAQLNTPLQFWAEISNLHRLQRATGKPFLLLSSKLWRYPSSICKGTWKFHQFIIASAPHRVDNSEHESAIVEHKSGPYRPPETRQRRLGGEQNMHNADVHHRAGPGVQAVTATTRAATGASDSAACIWLPELISHIADFMPRNEVACCLRLVNRAAAAALQGARYTTIR